jgi:hypothetical protein
MNPVPRSIIQLIRNEQISFSQKAQGVLYSGQLTLDDLISSILNGSVAKRERDETGRSRFKYTIIGPTLSGKFAYSCGKIVKYGNETEYFIITFHEAR